MILKTARKIAVLVVGGTALLVGVVMLVTPGPGIIGILTGLAILATEFIWARTLLKRMKQRATALAAATAGRENPLQPETGRDHSEHHEQRGGDTTMTAAPRPPR